jgi:surface protein
MDLTGSIKESLIDNDEEVLEYLVTKSGKKLIGRKVARINYINSLSSYGVEPEKLPFITVWEINESVKKVVIPINSKYIGEYNYTVDWGDGNIDKDVNDTISHEYEKEGNYTVKISGSYPAFQSTQGSWGVQTTNILEVKSWGDINWKSFEGAFAGTHVLITATDTPYLKNVKSLANMFSKVNGKIFDNDSIVRWKLSEDTNLSGMFSFATSFNQPLNDWDVSSVTDMSGMFNSASSFNQPLDKWYVSNVTNMRYMFCYAKSFDQNISMWNVSNVTDYSDFATGSPIDGTDKMPKFK